ncbi:MAG TPA: methylmalonyl Co-A mutase-associated GTPase MeaB [Acidobacteriaceae bacterium]|nr:methylmalonyl Co-A mutase-associated GTPase MeaB [Acidobacteriaceae bacterium]
MTATAISDLVARLRAGDTRALARAISLVENDAPEAPALLSACFPHTGRALRIGVTGAPGAGKSTLVDRLARAFRDAGKSVGVVAVDPTSPFTGGAILGDRIRFREHQTGVPGESARHSDPGFYLRSMATRGSLGGLALATADVALVLEASGKDVLLIETVGVGQDEIEIARLADITLVILVPGMGDDVQSLKAGVMEIADIFVINKSDRDGADRVEQEIRGLQSLAPATRSPARFELEDHERDSASLPGRHSTRHPQTAFGSEHDSTGALHAQTAFVSGHDFSRAEMAPGEKGALAPEAVPTPPVIRTVATTGDGLPALTSAIAALEQWLRDDKRLAARRTAHWQRRLDAMLRTELMRRARQNGFDAKVLQFHAARIASGQQDPWQLVAQLTEKVFNPEKSG